MWLAIWKNNNNSFFDKTRYLAKSGFFKTTRRSTVSDHFNFWQDIIKNTTELCDVKQSSLYQSTNQVLHVIDRCFFDPNVTN